MIGEDRFYPLVAGIKAQLGAVYEGENAIAVRNHISWPDRLRHDNGRVLKLYIELGASQQCGLNDLDAQLESLGIAEDHFDWTFMREQIGRKLIPAACFRNREWDGNPSPHIWGFGRPHPFDPFFTPHQLLSGPVVYRRSTAVTTPSGWEFEPVWICTIVGGKPYFARHVPRYVSPSGTHGAMIFMGGNVYDEHDPQTYEPGFIPEPLLEFARKSSFPRRTFPRPLPDGIPLDTICDVEILEENDLSR